VKSFCNKITSIPLSPSFPVFSKPLHATYYPNSGYLETEKYFTTLRSTRHLSRL